MTGPPVLRVSDRMQVLLERLRRDSDRIFGKPRARIEPLTFQVRESSEVSRVRVTTGDGVRYAFAKIFRPRPGETGSTAALARFRRDYDVTRTVFQGLTSTPELRSVEPIACYEDLLGVVTNEVAGVPLNVLIARDAAWPTQESRVDDLRLAVSRVGRWIAAFQEFGLGEGSTAISLDATREYIDVRLRRLTTLPHAGFSESDRREILTYLDCRVAELRHCDLVEVPVHGDIVPSNIIVGTDSVTVLDFAMTTRASRYLDIARLYTQLEFYTAKPQYRRHVIGRLQQAALEAFEPGLAADHPSFDICAVQHVVCHYLSHARQPGSFPVNLYSHHQCRRHRTWLRARARNRTPRLAVRA